MAFSQLGGTLHWAYFLLTLIAGLLIQGRANTINDYFDHKSGNDEANREYVRPFSGGSRLIQLGLLAPVEGLGVVAVLGAAFLGFIAYMYWNVEHQKRIFHGLKGVVGQR